MRAAETIKGSNRKKILLISYHFPPSLAIGGQRIVNFAKHLPQYGWDTSVLTVDDRYFDAVDREGLKDMETCHIIRTRQLPKLSQGYKKIKELFHRSRKASFGLSRDPIATHLSQDFNLNGPEKLSQKLKRWFISLFLTLPDTERNWTLPAVFRAVKEIKKGKINCILTTCPPYTTQLIGLLVKTITRAKWVADFRDPWMTAGRKLIFTCALSNKIESFLEKKVIQKADLITFNSHRLRDAYQNKYCGEPDSKFAYIPNGINAESFSEIGPLKKYRKFTLSYTGTLYGDRSPEPIFKALKQLALEGKTSLSEVNVKLVGYCHYVNGHSILSMIHGYGVESVVDVLGAVPRTEALQIIRRSHLALLFATNQPFQIPSKVYDYMGTGTKILAITEEGATSDLLQSTFCGSVFDSADIEGIKEFVLRTMQDQAPQNDNCVSAISQLDARNTTKSLSDLLNKVVFS
jgi:glycosyltransferase involved in cell wall biosynthesis